MLLHSAARSQRLIWRGIARPSVIARPADRPACTALPATPAHTVNLIPFAPDLPGVKSRLHRWAAAVLAWMAAGILTTAAVVTSDVPAVRFFNR